MTAPRRWLDPSGEATPEERALLRLGADEDLDPPPDAEERTWNALLGSGALGPTLADPSAPVPPAPAPAPPTSPPPVDPSALGSATATASAGAGAGAAVTTTVGVGVGKTLGWLAGLAVVGSLSVASYSALSPAENALQQPSLVVSASATPAAMPAVTVATVAATPGGSASADEAATPVPVPVPVPGPASIAGEAPVAAVSGAAPRPLPSAGKIVGESATTPREIPDPADASDRDVPAIASAAPPAPATEERARQRREEFELTNQARAELRAGHPAAALAALTEAQRRFPGGAGVLGQEREVIAIEALAASGQVTTARQRAAAFLQAHPQSAHAARLAPFTSP
jgi:hypothetical protein